MSAVFEEIISETEIVTQRLALVQQRLAEISNTLGGEEPGRPDDHEQGNVATPGLLGALQVSRAGMVNRLNNVENAVARLERELGMEGAVPEEGPTRASHPHAIDGRWL